MSYHIVSIDSPQCSLSCKDGQLTCRVDGEEEMRTIPLEDVASIIITSFSASVHSKLLIEAAKHGIALILCESFQPVSILLPANRSTDTLLTRAQLDITGREKETLWRRTVNAKVKNQLLLARHLAPQDGKLEELEAVLNSSHEHKEAMGARIHWGIFGRSLGLADFIRDQSKDGVNALLNYGYAVLLSTTLQKLFGVGLDPTFGIFHVTREQATPLAYDLMEPFRPCVDWRVAQWVRKQQREAPAAALEVTKEFRRWVTAFPLEKVDYLDMTIEIRGVIEGVVRSFRRALLEHKPTIYKPWTPNSIKWAGC
jgi:CRISPR-associated protein Cas1|uniref:type II CRISPR-associated endonuclease Cas1 n=1 Tax=Prosthecobacter sp. TaxID=1965333 RepID=UPI003785001F